MSNKHKYVEMIDGACPTKYTIRPARKSMNNHGCITVVGYFPTPCYVLSETKKYHWTNGTTKTFEVANKWYDRSLAEDNIIKSKVQELDYNINPFGVLESNTFTTSEVFNTYEEAKKLAQEKNENILAEEEKYILSRIKNVRYDQIRYFYEPHMNQYKTTHKQLLDSADKLYETTINHKENNEPTK